MPMVKLKPEFINVKPYGRVEVLVVPPMSPVVERRHYTKASVVHPAKMSVALCRALVRRYTREGETVLDPMAGIGTTLIESMLLDRNAIGIELEKKFVKIVEENIELLKKIKTLAAGAHAKIIKGDARRLTKLLEQEVDTAVFSPPYEKQITQGGTTGAYKAKYGYQQAKNAGYSNSPKNIGNLKYGKPDTVIFSPPFSSSFHGGDKFFEKIANQPDSRRYGRSLKSPTHIQYKEGYGKNRDNIGNLKYGNPVDAVVFSPPFGEAHSSSDSGVPNGCAKEVFSKRSWLKGDNPKSIDNLKYGKPVDAVVFSPPFSEQIRNEHIGKNSNWAKMVDKKYGHMEAPQDKENIGNLKYGKSVDSIITSPPYSEGIGHRAGPNEGKSIPDEIKSTAAYKARCELQKRHMSIKQSLGNIGSMRHGSIDTVITSPPYSNSYLGGGNAEARKERLAKAGYNPKDYLGGRARNTVLKHYTEVDSIVTSPPYEDALGKHHVTSKLQKIKRDWGEYSTDSTNIGNQKGATYLSEMKKIYGQCFRVLKPGGKMVLVLKVFVRNKKIQRLDLDTKRLCEAVGFKLAGIKLFRLRQRSFWRILQLRKYGNQIRDKYLLDFEIIQIFQKPDSRSPAKEA